MTRSQHWVLIACDAFMTFISLHIYGCFIKLRELSFVMASRNHVLNNEKPQKIVDFVDDSGYFTGFCVIMR